MIKFEHKVNEIRKDHKSIFNRLKSIEEDALFIDQVAALYPHLPLTANERCGSWYINPTKHKVHSVYFKSTDGHTGEWDFNVRRGNFHWLETIAAHQGAIVVDSTRRGKRIPDALSKTIPIWCCVINRAVQQYNKTNNKQLADDWDTRFHSLPSAVFRSEHAQIELRIDTFVQKLWDLGVDIERLARLVKKPLRPVWLTPQSNLDHAIDTMAFYPILCVSASEFIENGGCQSRPSGYLYVQGSADDQEAWSMGLTCGLFWKHHQDILQHTDTCEAKVRDLVQAYRQERQQLAVNDTNGIAHVIQGTSLVIGDRGAAGRGTFDAMIQCCYSNNDTSSRKHFMDLAIPEGKKGQHVLEKAIPLAIDFCRPYLAQGKQVLVYSVDGKDRAVGITLALFVHYYNDKAQFTGGIDQVITKESIRQKLVQLIASHPQAAPSRVTLRRVNTHFLSASANTE
ncbi:tRNA A64-2'-O-ribosylphosphate transferase [Chlamydoabsidia padenii]|nr:tRNA A64-2'-O-ribosylphosphate transferase [Chlamydoabsidia padenii]